MIYRQTKNAWMIRDIFDKWFHEGFVPSVRRHLRPFNLKGKAVLTLDHCLAHPHAEYAGQWSRDGDKETGKSKSCSCISTTMNSDEEIEIYLKSVNVKNCCIFSKSCMGKHLSGTIQNCWKKCTSVKKNTDGNFSAT